MLVKILGAIDLVAGIILIFNITSTISKPILGLLGFLFLIKTFFFGMPKNFASWIDLVTGIFFLLSLMIQMHFLGIILGILLFQKAIFSFL